MPATATAPARPAAWITVALYIAIFVTTGAVAPYVAVYFQDLGLSLDAIGIFAGASALCGLFAAPLWGALADQRLGARIVMVLAALAAAVLAAVVGLAEEAAIAVLFAVLFQLAAAGIGPVLDAYTLDQIGAQRSRYARYRAWGSASFVVSTVAVGVLIQVTNLRALFIPAVAALVVAGLLALALPARTTTHAARSLGGIGDVLRVRPMLTFLIASLVVWGATAMVNGFFSIYMVSLNASTSLVGSAWALGAIVEVPAMIAFPLLAGRFGIGRVLVFGAVAFLLRIVVLLVSNDPIVLTAAMALHGIGYAFLLVGGVTYVAGLAPSGRAATAQGVFAGVIAGLAQVVGPVAGGLIAGAATIPFMFVVAAVVSVVGVVVLAYALARAPSVAAAEPVATELTAV